MQVWQQSPARSGFGLQVRARFPLRLLTPCRSSHRPPDSCWGVLCLRRSSGSSVCWSCQEPVLGESWSCSSPPELHLWLLPRDILLPAHA